MNVTYLLGAGASAKACPILSDLGKKMMELATTYLDPPINLFLDKKLINPTPIHEILHYIGYFGNKAKQYGTIDTYAKKLYLSNDNENELDHLKRSISLFFTIWESMDSDNNIKADYKKIDPRYINLLSSILERTSKNQPKLKENIKFVTWNYDLQFERAYKSFCMDHLGWDYVSDNLKFRHINNDFDVCHLNGYSGFYSTEKKEVDLVDRGIENLDAKEILEELKFVIKSQHRSSLSFDNQISYAWGKNDAAEHIRKSALGIFRNTDILIVIGYSFPPFNKEIDQILLKELGGRKTKIYYQDPKASEEFISILTEGMDTEIHCIKDRMDQFFLPYDF